MSIPERAGVQSFNDFVNRINEIVALLAKDASQIQMKSKRLSKEIEASRTILGDQFYFVLKGMIAGIENKKDDVHHFFLSAMELNTYDEINIQYILALHHCFEYKQAYDIACSVYGRDGTNPKIYLLIGESAHNLGLPKTALEWFKKYEHSTKSTYLDQDTEALEKIVNSMAKIDEVALSKYINAATQFMKSQDVKPISFELKSINGDILEACFKINFSSKESTQFFYNFVTSDYILDIPDEILSNVTINFPPYVC